MSADWRIAFWGIVGAIGFMALPFLMPLWQFLIRLSQWESPVSGSACLFGLLNVFSFALTGCTIKSPRNKLRSIRWRTITPATDSQPNNRSRTTISIP